ncbi:MAG: DUF3987 domain-containing protein [Paludibacteraceae bacterium]|nr:DUF3987 domain-containing protein [Paludibacteraceae bacterium]
MNKNLIIPAVPNQDSQDMDDLRIVEYLNLATLPEPLQKMLSQAATPAEQDMLLMATLTATSACLPNLYFRYGMTGKRYYANLQCFILAAAASGKGIANQALEMIQPVEDIYPTLIPGDSTFPAFFKRLYENGGHGYVHESEGSVITDIWKSQAATYNSILRKAAEHEQVSHNRVKEMQVIPCPQLSVLLTGTFSQYRHLVPNIENGYFSRLLPLIVRDTQPFDSRYVEAAAPEEPISRQVGQQLANLCTRLYCQPEQEWSLTKEQKSRLAQHLSTEYKALISMLGENFHSAVVRMAVQIERIAMILTAMRIQNTDRCTDRIQKTDYVESGDKDRPSLVDTIYCSDEDYEAAEMIGGKLILHAAVAYKMIEGERAELVPQVETSCQKQMLYERLGGEYEHQELLTEAKVQGISRATAQRWNERWLTEGKICRIQRGMYKKIS